MAQIDNSKIYTLVNITDKRGNAKANQREIYRQIIGGKAQHLLVEELLGSEPCSILRMEVKTKAGKSLNFHTSGLEELQEKNGELLVKTQNSIYLFAQTQERCCERELSAEETGERIELCLQSDGNRFCKGELYDGKGNAASLACIVQKGMMMDSCLITPQGETCGEAIVCRYFLKKGGVIQFYDMIYGQQDRSLPIRIHNVGNEPLYITFEGSSVKIEIEPLKTKTLLPCTSQNRKEDEKLLYKIELEDCAVPSFCSASKPLFGTMEEIDRFIKSHEADKDSDGQVPEIVTAFEKWKAGEKDVTHFVAYTQQPLLVSANWVFGARYSCKQYQWEHTNIWDCVYSMRCSRVDTEHRWVECAGRYYRCVMAEFENLEWAGDDGRWCRVDENIWGLAHVMCFEENRVSNILAELEKVFHNKDEMEKDHEEFLQHPSPVFTEFCNEIFGDG